MKTNGKRTVILISTAATLLFLLFVYKNFYVNLKERFESGAKLAALGKALLISSNSQTEDCEDSLQRIKEYAVNKEDFEWWLENVRYLGRERNTTGLSNPKTPIAYDKTLLRKVSGTNVLFLDGHVKFVRAKDLNNVGITIMAPQMGQKLP